MLSENISQTKRKTLCGVINRWNIKSDLEKQGREVAAGAGGGGYRESLERVHSSVARRMGPEDLTYGVVTTVIDNTVWYNWDLLRKENLSILSKDKKKMSQ